MNPNRWILAALAGCGAVFLAAALPAQVEPEQLRRDQEEILRKSERLRDLMERLQARYEREGRVEYVELLKAGLQHVKQSGLLEDVAGIRSKLQSDALAEAVQKQTEVVHELERLLAILLDRRSVENLEHEIAQAERIARDANELLRAQTRLQQQTRQAARGEPTPAEQQLARMLAELAERQAAESAQNQRQAGTVLPGIEDALQRVRALLQRQQQLEQTAAAEQAPQAGSDQRKAQQFTLGELEETQRERMAAASRERDQSDVQRTARALRTALDGGDTAAIQRAQRELQQALDGARARAAEQDRPSLTELQQRASADAADKQALREAAAKAETFAERTRQEKRAQDETARAELARKADELARVLGEGREPGRTAQALQEARAALQRAQQEQQRGDVPGSLARESEALRKLSEAKTHFQAENPDAARLAREIADGSHQTARDLDALAEHRQEHPTAPAARKAAQALARSEQGASAAEERLRTEEPAARGVELEHALQESRAGLQEAERALSEALDQATADRRDELQAAAQRQQQLRDEAARAQERLQQSAGELAPRQGEAASKSLQQAAEQMQRAQQSLRHGQQSAASVQQRAASERLREAKEALERNRPVDEQDKQALAELAKEQARIEEDILRLARLVQERKNRAAQQALEEAGRAAQRARRNMEEADPEETDEAQQQAREQLQKAVEELEQERDRYEDLRAEELLFKIRDELTQFLEQQRPITAATSEAARSVAADKQVGRRLRKKLQELGSKEKELSAKAEFLRESLAKEDVHVFTHALQSTADDLAEVARRLGAVEPDAGGFTQLLQQDVEDRTVKLIEALKREQQRRQQERQQQQQQQNQQRNQRSQQRLVPFVAELKMLKQMEQDALSRLQQIEKLLQARGADQALEAELALVERLASRHSQITAIFHKLKQQIEQALQDGGQQPDASGEERKR